MPERLLLTHAVIHEKSDHRSIIGRTEIRRPGPRAVVRYKMPPLTEFGDRSAKTMSATHKVTELLAQWANGDEQALNQLTPIVYKELRKLAAAYLRKEQQGHTLQPTALVHEAYVRLVDQKKPDFQNRSHFFGVAARLMRQILVDHARRRHAAKRSAGPVPLDSIVSFEKERSEDLIALDRGLCALDKFDPRKCKVVELRYFVGLSMEEIAQALELSEITVRRDLRMAQAWLQREIEGG